MHHVGYELVALVRMLTETRDMFVGENILEDVLEKREKAGSPFRSLVLVSVEELLDQQKL